MKYIVIRAKDDEDKQDILRRLNGRYLEWTELSDPRESADNQISLIMADGVSFTLSCNANQSTSNDNLPSRAAADDVPSTSYGLRGMGVLSDTSNHHQSNPPVRTESNGYDAQQYPYSQSLARGYGEYTNYQSHPLAMNESNGYYVYQYDYSQLSAHSYGGYPMNNIYIENEIDGLSMKPSTSAPKRPMDDSDSKENDDQAKKPRNELEKGSLVAVRCQVCKHMYSSKNREFVHAQHHAATHPNPRDSNEKFKCPVDGCDFTNCWMFNVEKHFRKHHRYHYKDFKQFEKKFELTHEEKKEWVQHVKKCFPETINQQMFFR